MAKSLDKFELKLQTKSDSTQNLYRSMLSKFLDRWNLTAEEMFNEYWEIVQGKKNGSLDPRDADIYETRLALQMKGMVDEGYSPSYAHCLKNAVVFFFRSNGLEFSVPSEDLPEKDTRGGNIPSKQDIRRMLNKSIGMYELRNQALILILKDSGLRVSDIEPLNVEDYLKAKEMAKDYPGFAYWGDGLKTRKRKVIAYPCLGPESTEILDKYLEERKSGPVFIGMEFATGGPRVEWEATGEGRLSTDSIINQIRRLGSKVKNKRISAHGFRKFMINSLSGDLPEAWIKRLIGKRLPSSDDPYLKPHETGQLLPGYVKAYDSIRVYEPEVLELRDELTKLKTDRDAEIDKLKERIHKLISTDQKRFDAMKTQFIKPYEDQLKRLIDEYTEALENLPEHKPKKAPYKLDY
jgi:integrase